MATHEYERLAGAGLDRLFRLTANCMQSGGYVAERCNEGSVRGAHPDMTAECRDSRQNSGHCVLANSAYRERSRPGICSRIEVAGRKPCRRFVETRRSEQIG